MPSYAYAGHDEVADIIRKGKAGEDYVVVDVRDSDFDGGNITGARNYPSETFYENLDELIAETAQVPKVIWPTNHISNLVSIRTLPEQRGPKAARIYAEELTRRGARTAVSFEDQAALEAANSNNESPSPNIHMPPTESKASESVRSKEAPQKEVIVLRGGFTRWQEKYKDDPQLVEKYKASVWAGHDF